MRDEGVKDPSQYRTLFVQESREYLQSVSRLLLELMQSPKPETYNELFRMAHSIKGMAAAMNYPVIKDVSHAMEDLFDRMKKGEIRPAEEVISGLLSAVDLIEVMVTEIETTGSSARSGDAALAVLTRARAEKAPETRKPELAVVHPEAAQEPAPGETKFLYRIALTGLPAAAFPAAPAPSPFTVTARQSIAISRRIGCTFSARFSMSLHVSALRD